MRTYAVSKLTIEIINPIMYATNLLTDISYVIVFYLSTATCEIIVDVYRYNIIDIV